MRDGARSTSPCESRHRLWRLQRPLLENVDSHGTGKTVLGGRAVAVRKSGQGSHLSFSARLAARSVTARSTHSLFRISVPAPDPRRRRDVGENLAGPYVESPGAAAARVGR